MIAVIFFFLYTSVISLRAVLITYPGRSVSVFQWFQIRYFLSLVPGFSHFMLSIRRCIIDFRSLIIFSVWSNQFLPVFLTFTAVFRLLLVAFSCLFSFSSAYSQIIHIFAVKLQSTTYNKAVRFAFSRCRPASDNIRSYLPIIRLHPCLTSTACVH